MNPKPTLIVIAGPNGSGKTSVTTQILKHEWVEGCVYINPDNIAQQTFGDWNAPEAVWKAAQLATELREKCLREHQSFIFEFMGFADFTSSKGLRNGFRLLARGGYCVLERGSVSRCPHNITKP